MRAELCVDMFGVFGDSWLRIDKRVGLNLGYVLKLMKLNVCARMVVATP